MCPCASQIIVHGEGRNYVTALITLDADALVQWGRAHGLVDAGYPALAAHPEVHAQVRASVEHVNSRVNRWETVKDFRILDHDLTVESGELTPSMKVRRKVVESTYRPVLDSMYASSAQAPANT